MPSDCEIAQSAPIQPISRIAASLGLSEEELELYGPYKAKIPLRVFHRLSNTSYGKLILVTAMTPTPAGEGKTTTTIGLGQALSKLGKRACVAIREPSLGPCFGIKGGAAGGGRSQVIPMEDINLHFTGDIHAVTAAHNLLAAMLDNHLHFGNSLDIDPRAIVWHRVLDMNDRALRNIVIGLGGRTNGVPRETGFDITVASEIMAVLCLAESIEDLKARLSRMIVAYTYEGNPVTAGDLKAAGALAVLLKDALKPNLVQTIEGTPAFVHGGPFANIAHGCNSVIATKLGLHLAEYLVTEAGFGADLGAEKFFNIKCRSAGLTPSAAVVVASVRALKMHGGVPKDHLAEPDPAAVERGFPNLLKHCEIVRTFGVPLVVAVNRFPSDSEEELSTVLTLCEESRIPAALSEVHAKGGEGGIALAEMVLEASSRPSRFRFLYDEEMHIRSKIGVIASEIYGADRVVYTPEAEAQIRKLESLGLNRLPICMAKTQYSLSDNPALLGRPENFVITVRDLKVSAGAGFIVAYTGNVTTMPALPRHPAAENMDVDENGVVSGLF
jgi:formate--tetrahydrofolate ligase